MTYVKIGRVPSSLFLLKEQWEGYSWKGSGILCHPKHFPNLRRHFVWCFCMLQSTSHPSWNQKLKGGSSHLVIPRCAFPLPHLQASLLFFSTLLSWEAGWAWGKPSHTALTAREKLFRGLYLLELLQALSGLKIGEKQFRNEWRHGNPRARMFRIPAAWFDVQTLIPDPRCQPELTLLRRKTLFC